MGFISLHAHVQMKSDIWSSLVYSATMNMQNMHDVAVLLTHEPR